MAVYLIESKLDQQKLIDYVGEDTAKLFFSIKDRLKAPENDIYYWLKKSPEELKNRLSELQGIKTRSQKDKEASKGAELLYNQDGWKVYHITTYEASVKYGKNTQWCIAGSKRWSNGERGEEYFNDYTSKGVKFYFYIENNDEKYALAYYDEEDYQVFNQVDDEVTIEDLSFLPNVPGLPKFNYDDLLSEDGTYIYEGSKIPESLKDKIKRVKVSNSVTKIGNWALAYCESLTSIDIPNSVTEIGDSAFCGCYSLASINMPDSVTMIDAWAFQYCTSLTSINVSDSVTKISQHAFYYCPSLKSINIPDSVTEIGYGAFSQGTSLTSINIPDSVTEIGDYAFSGCYSLTVYTDNDYAVEYCEGRSIPYKPANEFPG